MENNHQTESRLLQLAALFLGLNSLILTLSPAVRARSWDVDYLYAHWLGFIIWLTLSWLTHLRINAAHPNRDPYLFPVAALFSGWGMLTIWRLYPNFGLKQSLWLSLSLAIFIVGLHWKKLFPTLRRYKYTLLAGGLILTALTLLFGANPLQVEPRLWLNFGGIYLQPSELLKLLLVIYLAAYLADHPPFRQQFAPFLFPTLFLSGIALLLLTVQRDLGTASILIMLFACTLYVATGRKRILLANAVILFAIAIFGYHLSATIHNRINIWLSPWSDPSGFGYQIIQALMAIANGELWGRGTGIGSPLFVPVAHSDFVFTALAEETGLAGTLGLLLLLGIFLMRGMITALRAPNRFQRLLATGLTTYLGIQSLLIIGGNLRLLPLTGVTLPFISYGGSSLLTSFITLLLLLRISDQNEEAAPLSTAKPYHLISGLLLAGLIAAALINGWWAIVRGPDLLTRSDNPRRAQADFFVPRGTIYSRSNTPINETVGTWGKYTREYLYPELAPIIGYTHPVYGQAGIEASLDDYLRGLAGNPVSLVWWNRLLYGQPPEGLDLRLSLDLSLQADADGILSKQKGALVLVNASSGEILAMASHPGFDPKKFNESILDDPNSPLLNRATQGSYPLPPNLASFFAPPTVEIRLPRTEKAEGFATPLQMAVAAAALSNEGVAPAPRLTLAVNTPQSGWVVLPPLGETQQLFSKAEAEQMVRSLKVDGEGYWQLDAREPEGEIQWLLAGTLPSQTNASLALAVILEDGDEAVAREIALELLKKR